MFLSSVNHPPELPLGVGRGPEAPTFELHGNASEDLAVRAACVLQLPMASTHKVLRQVIQKCQNVVYKPHRLGTAQPAAANQLGHEIFLLAAIRHASSLRNLAANLKDFIRIRAK
jgi:hypothetical protein